MNEFSEFLKGLFSTSEWPARWNCGYWSNFHGWLYIISEMLIWIAYFLIPLIILHYLFKKKTTLKFNKAYIYFAAFILLCGSTHFFDAMMFWIPMYRLNAVLRLATALVSLATVYHLIKILPEAFQQKTNVELEHEILMREEAERKLAEANSGLQAFAYVASHDLQEPLRKIKTFTELLYQSNRDKLDEKSVNHIAKTLSATDRMQALIKNVLTLSSLSENVQFKNLDLKIPVSQAIENLELSIHEKDAEVKVADLPVVWGNEGHLSQLFFNLISNAIKFCNAKPVINITGEVQDNTAVIYVSDNGIGMSKDDKQSIFEAFQRLHSKSEYEGTGIGLAIVKKIIDIHKGSIDVESEPGKGTTFIIHLPVANG